MSELERSEIDLKCEDHSFVGECIMSLYNTDYDFYVNFESGYYKNVQCLNTGAIYQFDRKSGKLFLTSLEYNSEDEYISLYVTDIKDGVPQLELDATDIYFGFFEGIIFRFKTIYYKFKFNRIK